MGARMRLLALSLTILMMMTSFLASKVIKKDLPKHEHVVVNGRRLLLDDLSVKSRYPKQSSVNNHHYIPREDFNNYPGGDGSDGSG
ncbi:putative BEL1-like homeodomain 8 [Hibiscus syriacus]|uniref:BEL1-like homeodomain 8 n=1 Tax=Hibiscus syriacus TaxID=106335 RepID=A0A6A2ZM16_HIBSY|nr:putative BEL1-like homeodomain 8 [Hibiscus syriacus]